MENYNNGITRRERAVEDMDEVLQILDRCKIIHLGLLDEDEVYIVPMNYGYTYEDDKLTFYVHGALKGRKMEVMRQHPKVSFEMESDVISFPGKMACQYGCSYSCVMGKGVATILEDTQEKMDALTKMMKTQTGLNFTFNEKMASIVNVVRIYVTGWSAKKRPLPEAMQQ